MCTVLFWSVRTTDLGDFATFYSVFMIVRSQIKELRAQYLGCVQFHVYQYLRYLKYKFNESKVQSDDYFFFSFFDSEGSIEELRA